jgi:hypothetical protein
VACLKILQGYSRGRDSELVFTDDEHGSWQVQFLVDSEMVELQGMLQVKSHLLKTHA